MELSVFPLIVRLQIVFFKIVFYCEDLLKKHCFRKYLLNRCIAGGEYFDEIQADDSATGYERCMKIYRHTTTVRYNI
jgi:hypothetical protein